MVWGTSCLNLFLQVRPGLKVPGRRAVGGRILDSVHKEEWEKFTAKFKDEFATLMIDGWSTLSNDPVLGVLVDNFFVDAIDTTGV